jgi:hypothetical protein
LPSFEAECVEEKVEVNEPIKEEDQELIVETHKNSQEPEEEEVEEKA